MSSCGWWASCVPRTESRQQVALPTTNQRLRPASQSGAVLLHEDIILRPAEEGTSAGRPA